MMTFIKGLFLIWILEQAQVSLCDKHPNISIYWGIDGLDVYCTLDKNVLEPNSHMALYLGETFIASKEIYYFLDSALFSDGLDINDHMKDDRIFTQFKCRYIENSTGLSYDSKDTVTIPYLFCDPQGSECAETQCPVNDEMRHYCLRTINGTRPCVDKYQDCIGDFTKWIKYCPVDATGWCAAMAKNPKAVWYSLDTRNNVSCLDRSEISPVSFKGKPLRMFDYVVVDTEEDAKLRFDCPKNSPFYETHIGQILTDGEICRDKMDIEFWYGNSTGLATWTIEAHKRKVIIAEFKYNVVRFGSNMRLLLENGSNFVKCHFFDGPDLPWDVGFSVRLWWTHKFANGRVEVIHADSTYAALYNIDDNEEYQCHVNVSFKSCNPYFATFRLVQSDVFKRTPSGLRVDTSSQYRQQGVSPLCGFMMLVLVEFHIKRDVIRSWRL